MKLRKWTPCLVMILILLQSVATSGGKNQILGGKNSITPNQEPDYVLPYINETNVVIDGQIGADEYKVSFQDLRTDIFVYWQHNTTVLTVGLVAPGTGYVAFGIGPGMSDSDMVIGGVTSTGSVYAYDMYSSAQAAPDNDTSLGGTYDILAYAATEAGGKTTFEFQIPFNSGDAANDKILTAGQMSNMFIAFHDTSDDIVYHTARSNVWNVMISSTIYTDVVYPPFDTSIPLIKDSKVVIDGVVGENEYTEFYHDPFTGINAYWEHNEVNLTIALVSPGTGWVAIGFGATMQDSPMILGGVNGSDSGSTYCLDLVGTANFDHALDTSLGGTDDISACAATENGGQTTLEMIIPMNSGDQYDPALSVNNVYPLMLAYSASSDFKEAIHTSTSVFSALVRPETVGIVSVMQIDAPTEVEFNTSFTIKITLMDNESNPYVGRDVEFFIRTALGDYVIDTKKTDANGQANITYIDQHLIYEHYFGARFKQVVEPAGKDLAVYLGVEAVSPISFLEAPKEKEPLIQRYSREGLITIFWITGLIIWGSFSVSIYGIWEIFKDRERAGKKEVAKQ